VLRLILAAALLQSLPDDCGLEGSQALARASALRSRAGVAAATPELVSAAGKMPACLPLAIAGWAVTGWLEARATASKAGAPEVLGPARARLATLEAMSRRATWRVQNEYARAAITAAIAASQDERLEMGAYLVHARSLSDRLSLAGERAEWPLPIDELEGELWLEVDRFEEARTAYGRAVEAGGGPTALVGLARAADRLGDERAACGAYRRSLDSATDALAEEAQAYLTRCP
jgi:hypothetical protein